MVGGEDDAVADHEHVVAGGFTDPAVNIEQQRLVDIRGLRLDLGQDEVEVVQAFDVCVEDLPRAQTVCGSMRTREPVGIVCGALLRFSIAKPAAAL